MRTIADFFGLGKSQAELDFVDVPLATDLALFLDPYTFSVQDDDWSLRCNEAILSFFETALHCVRMKQDVVAQQILNGLSEPNETHLGLSSGHPQGRGVSGKQAFDLYRHLKASRAAATGLLSELADCDLFIEGIGPDKISDISTNIIRRELIVYTQEQCRLHGIPLRKDVPSGRLWNATQRRWEHAYVDLPVVHSEKLLLVPKASVRWSLAFSPQRYYRSFVLNYLQKEILERGTGLVEILKSGRRIVTKKSVEEQYPFSKGFLEKFSEKHPEVLDEYKKRLQLPPELSNQDLDENFDPEVFADVLIDKLREIPAGQEHASGFHSLILGALEFIFYPHLIYPQLEFPINMGRKRIDIKFTNNAKSGFFFRRRLDGVVRAINVFVECKNYTHELANPELDQISGRFSPSRGRLGFIVARKFENREKFVLSCRDTAQDDRGFIIPLVDKDILDLLVMVAGNRSDQFDRFLEVRFDELVA